MFTGNYFNSIDSKGRAFVPAKLRFSLGERVWIVKGFDSCVYLLTDDAWRKLNNTYIASRTLEDSRARKLQRFFLGNSKEVDIDKQGRVNLPPEYISFAGIDKDVVFVGCGERIEIWAKEAFEKETASDAADPDELLREARRINVSSDEEQ